jgi:hypothetical protein
MVRLRSLFRAEQRRLVAANETIDHVPVLDVERRNEEDVLGADGLGERSGADRIGGVLGRRGNSVTFGTDSVGALTLTSWFVWSSYRSAPLVVLWTTPQVKFVAAVRPAL